MRIGIIPNISKDTDLSITQELLKWLTDKKIQIILEQNIANKLSCDSFFVHSEDILKNSDLIIVLGGDGTLLNVSRQAAFYNIPLFGINLGHLGFLTEVEKSEMYCVLDKLISKDFKIEKRMMLEAYIERDSIKLDNFIALNDIGITRGPFSRIINYRIFVNDNLVDNYFADGIVISSPTGSTAYSLSAGGPIVCPDLEVIIITPICPHTLHSRSLIISPEDTVKIEICANNLETMLTVDGQHGYKLEPHDIVTIKKSQYYTSLIKLQRRDFFEVLRQKMSERWKCKSEI